MSLPITHAAIIASNNNHHYNLAITDSLAILIVLNGFILAYFIYLAIKYYIIKPQESLLKYLFTDYGTPSGGLITFLVVNGIALAVVLIIIVSEYLK